MDAHLDERSFVDQEVDPLTRGQLPARVLLFDLLGAAPKLGLLAPFVEVANESLHPGLLAGVRLGRRLGGIGCVFGRGLLGGFAHRPFQFGSRFSKKAVTPSMASSVPSSIVSCERK
jgi:hypothetical protein